MSQHVPRHALPSTPDLHSSVIRCDSHRSYASSSSFPYRILHGDKPTSSSTGLLIDVPSLSSVGSLPHPEQRLPRPSIPTPPSTTGNVAISLSSNTPPELAVSATQRGSSPVGCRTIESPSMKASVEQTTFYSDSSNPSSPDEKLSRAKVSRRPNDCRSVSGPVGMTAASSLFDTSKTATMAATMASSSSTNNLSTGPHRMSSIGDKSIPTMSSKRNPSKAASQEAQRSTDITSIIQAAGSPEAVIQHLLKEKQSQSQQNSQLWRLVDKQRAMILGLNRDLESALKEKEKYRRKLKEMMSNPAIVKAASGRQGEVTKDVPERGARSPRINVPESRALTAAQGPDSPSIDSDSQKNSPIDLISMAPYPITPPADKPLVSPNNAASEMVDPRHNTPKSQEHALGNFAPEVDENAAERLRKEEGEPPLREIPYNISLPPSRTLPSDPPKVPPPKIPTVTPSLIAVEASPQLDEGLNQFPSPPKKAPPAPLQLKQQARSDFAVSLEGEDSDSDYDDILEVNGERDEIRGRRKTRDDDDRERETIAFRDAPERNRSRLESQTSGGQATHQQTSSSLPKDGEGDKLAEALSLGDGRALVAPPLLSPGLPSSPRPINNIRNSASAPLATRLIPATPLSPRPPRHPIMLPPNTTVASSPPSESSSATVAPLNVLKRHGGEAGRQFSTERTTVYKGWVTDEYPDLLLPPNALPSIEIKVASSRMKPSRASLMSLTQLEEDPVFTLAVISRADRGELWRVEKDIASLGKLDARLKNCAAFTAKTPERSLFSGHAPAKLDARRVALEQYMAELLDTPLDTATALELCRYLSTQTLPPNADEAGSPFRPRPENSGPKTSSDGRPVRSGYLTKKGKNFGGWKARFFVLDGPQLKYYETPGGAHLGTIKLQNAQIGKQSQSQSIENHSSGQQNNGDDLDNQYRHAFLILEPKKKDSNTHMKHVLCAESDKERDLWVDVLLQWIDFRDVDDGELLSNVKSAHHERQISGADQASSSNRLKKGSQGKLHHQHANSGSLIGVRYDCTHAGEAPQKGSTALSELPGAHNPVNETMNSQVSKLISGPKHPQIISDSSAWGNKTSLNLPTLDEKKQRKRSFFGFGPRTRSSSDGQESLFGGSDNGSASGPSHSHAHVGPVRQVFGAPLAEAVRYNPPVDVNVPLPAVVFRCIQYLDQKNALTEEGIFRLSGSNVVIKQLRERYNAEGDVNLLTDEQYYDIHAVASLLKLYLRELPSTILTRDLHLDFLSTAEIQDRQEKVARLAELTQRLPQANVTLLKYLIAFLIRIINNSDVNKMNVRNVGIVFSPTLNIPAQVFAMFLQNYEGIFGINPEEYELPSPTMTTESDSQGVADAPPHRFEPPPRPSTSSRNSSPHRQPRVEMMREHTRSTPTPPLLLTAQSSRTTPTPPLGVRPAYESGYSMPTNQDVGIYHPSQRAAPVNNRPIYEATTENYENPEPQMSVRAKRRESAVYMGGLMNLQQQGSKSHLREAPRH